jgi:alpha-galactosidase
MSPALNPMGHIITRLENAFIAYDKTENIWEIATEAIYRRIRLDSGKGIYFDSLANPETGHEWLDSANFNPAFLITVGGETITSFAENWKVAGYQTQVHQDRSLELHIVLARDALHLHLHLVAFPGTSITEQWAVIENAGNTPLPVLTAINDFWFQLKPSSENFWLHWVQGLDPQGGNVGDPPLTASMKLRKRELSEGTTQDLFSTRRSSEENIGWFALLAPGEGEGLIGGIEWSGGWWMRASRSSGTTSVFAMVGDVTCELGPGDTFETPHRFIGFFNGGLDDAANVTHAFVRQYLMPPRPSNFPFTHFNTWYYCFVNLTEDALLRQVDLATELGLEAFCVDAGWYAGSPMNADFSFGLGTWRENREKFPRGLAAFADYVHQKGLKFGLWVEPERVDLKYAGPNTEIPYDWLSPRTPFDSPPPPGLPQNSLVCLGNPEARAWMKQTLARVIRDYHVDWLKWDDNMWMSCDPPNETRGNDYAHTRGLYEVLDYLHVQFPDLVIENCASGGHRMDFGLLRRTHIQWLADDTEPSYRVRYYIAGASYPFPPEYLNSWLVESYWEHIGEAKPGVLRAWLRSRMMGAFGISISLDVLNAEQRTIIADEIARYKNFRSLLKASRAYRLSGQTDLIAAPNLRAPAVPDIVEYYAPAPKEGIIMFWQGQPLWNSFGFTLMGLEPGAVYRIESDDRQISGEYSGQELMSAGIVVPYDSDNPSIIISIKAVD